MDETISWDSFRIKTRALPVYRISTADGATLLWMSREKMLHYLEAFWVQKLQAEENQSVIP